MNLLNAFGLLNMIREDLDGYQEEYKNYIIEHKERVSKFADLLKEKLPELFDNIDVELFDEMIREHDASKFEEPEFEAYAQKWFNNSGETLEYKEAWKHHWTNNEHHPEFWLGEDMPYIYILEMLCDWGSFSIDKGDFRELSDFYYNKAKDDEEKNLSANTKAIIEDILNKLESALELKESFAPSDLKQKQLEVILKSNPAPDSYHTWVRTIDNILTFEEALEQDEYKEDFDPSFTYSMAEEALSSGRIKVYSSYPITKGTFVTPSSLEAKSYAGFNKIYSKNVRLSEVAWIDPTQGIFVGRL